MLLLNMCLKNKLTWRDDRGAEGARLEIVCTGNPCTEGSNPSLSAISCREWS